MLYEGCGEAVMEKTWLLLAVITQVTIFHFCLLCSRDNYPCLS
jgi:hypothetical protein